MLYTINYTMGAETRREIVKMAIRYALRTGEEVRLNKDASIWTKSNKTTLVLNYYGYRPVELSIKGMTFEDIVEEVLEAFHF